MLASFLVLIKRAKHICFSAVTNFIWPASSWLPDFPASTLVMLNAVVPSFETSCLRLIFIKAQSSSSDYLIKMEQLASLSKIQLGIISAF